MGTKPAWAAACVPLALVAAVASAFLFVNTFDDLQQLLPVLLILVVLAISWYGGRRVGVIAALLSVVAVWTGPIVGAEHVSYGLTMIASLALLLTALMAGGLYDARDRAEGALIERDARLA